MADSTVAYGFLTDYGPGRSFDLTHLITQADIDLRSYAKKDPYSYCLYIQAKGNLLIVLRIFEMLTET